jgi:hypothetical protein
LERGFCIVLAEALKGLLLYCIKSRRITPEEA